MNLQELIEDTGGPTVSLTVPGRLPTSAPQLVVVETLEDRFACVIAAGFLDRRHRGNSESYGLGRLAREAIAHEAYQLAAALIREKRNVATAREALRVSPRVVNGQDGA